VVHLRSPSAWLVDILPSLDKAVWATRIRSRDVPTNEQSPFSSSINLPLSKPLSVEILKRAKR